MWPDTRPALVRREEKINEVKGALRNDTPGNVVLIWGSGGAGKTTLARQVMEVRDVQDQFRDGLLWVSLGGQTTEADVLSVQNRICRTLGLDEVKDTDEGTHRLKEGMRGKRCLLVVDDVWKTEHLEALDVLGPRGALLYTSRFDHAIKRQYARTDIEVCAVKPRGDIACALLRSAASMEEEEELPNEALALLDVCGGLPLTIVTVGSLRWVRGGRRPPEWKDILAAMNSARSEVFCFRHIDKGLADAYQVSLDSLKASTDDVEKAAFSALWFYGAWMEDQWVTEEGAGRVWGLNDQETNSILRCLARRSLIELDERNCSKAHDSMRDFLAGKAEQGARVVKLHAEIIRSGLHDPTTIDALQWRWPYHADYNQSWLPFHIGRCASDQELWSVIVNIWSEDALSFGVTGAKALTAALPRCQALQTLDLSWNDIGTEGAKALTTALPGCQALQTLDLSKNEIGAEGARAVAAVLPNCQALRTLDLNWNDIGADGATALAEALPHCKTLQTLGLGHNCIGAYGSKALAQALPRCQALHALNLSWNRLGAEGAAALAAGLPGCRTLMSLDLSWNWLGAEGAGVLAVVLPLCHALQSLDLCSNAIGAEGVRALAAVLPQCQASRALDLSSNAFGAEGAEAVAAVLSECQALQKLDLSCNGIDNEGVIALAKVLPQALQTLELSSNKIGDTGARTLATSLLECQILQTLDLSRNEIGVEGARALATALPKCQTLQTLDLSANEIGTEGAKAVVAALPRCQALQTLYIDDNKIDTKGAKALAPVLPECQALQTLDLSGNDFDTETAKGLAAAFPRRLVT